MSTSDLPIHYLLTLFPGFQLLDVAGPLDILNTLSINHPPTRPLTLTIIASTLDPVPTKPIPPTNPSTHKPKWTFSGFPTQGEPPSTNTTISQSFIPNVTYDSYLSALKAGEISEAPDAQHKPIDVLLIPGGIGTRIDRVDPATGESYSNVADLLEFIPKIAPHVRHAIMTVCTGSHVLARTGLLDHRRATTNMMRFDWVAEAGPRVTWLKGRRWVKSLPAEAGEDGFKGEIWTSAGISAGIDVMLAYVAELYGGLEVARHAAKVLEYEWKEIGEGEVDPMYGFTEAELGVVDQS